MPEGWPVAACGWESLSYRDTCLRRQGTGNARQGRHSPRKEPWVRRSLTIGVSFRGRETQDRRESREEIAQDPVPTGPVVT